MGNLLQAFMAIDPLYLLTARSEDYHHWMLAMEQKTILILGGYGNTGRPLARLLLQESNAQLVLADEIWKKHKVFADELNHAFEGNRVRGACVDASDLTSLTQRFQRDRFRDCGFLHHSIYPPGCPGSPGSQDRLPGYSIFIPENLHPQVNGISNPASWLLLYHRWRFPPRTASISGSLCRPIL